MFLADHGEEFLDHGRWLHGRSLFDELIRVPLVVKFPGNRGGGHGASREQVQGVDVVPTVLEAMGAAARRPTSAGRPLQRDARARRAEAAPGARRDQPPRLRGPRRAHGGRQVHPPLQPRRRRAATSTSRRDPKRADEHRRARTPSACACSRRRPRRAWRRTRSATSLQVARRGPLRAHARDARLARGGRGDRPRAAASARAWAATGARLELRAAAARRARRARSASPCARSGRRSRSSGTRDGRPLRPADVAVGAGGLPPRGVPVPAARHRVRDRAATAASTCSRAPPAGAPGVRVWLALPAGPDGRGAGRGDARAAEGARLRGPGLAGGPAPRLRPRRHARRLLPRHRRGGRTRRSQRVAPGAAAIPLERDPRLRRRGARASSSSAACGTPGSSLPADEVLPVYLECYAERLLDTTRLYPGVARGPRRARAAATLAVLTNKPGDFSRDDPGGPRRRPPASPASWGAGDVPARKPDPGGLLAPAGRARTPRPGRPGWSATPRPTSPRPGPPGCGSRASPGASTRVALRAAGPDRPDRPAARPRLARWPPEGRRPRSLCYALPSLLCDSPWPTSSSGAIRARSSPASCPPARRPRRCALSRPSRPRSTGAARRWCSPTRGCLEAERDAVEAWLAGRRLGAGRAGGGGGRRPRATRCCAASPSSTTCSCGR